MKVAKALMSLTRTALALTGITKFALYPFGTSSKTQGVRMLADQIVSRP